MRMTVITSDPKIVTHANYYDEFIIQFIRMVNTEPSLGSGKRFLMDPFTMFTVFATVFDLALADELRIQNLKQFLITAFGLRRQ